MSKDVNLKEVWSGTRDVYRRRAERFDAERSKILFERKWLERFENLLPEKAELLDLGCGSGEPISKYFIEKGFSLTGIDYAEPMIEIARQRFPEFLPGWILDLLCLKQQDVVNCALHHKSTH